MANQLIQPYQIGVQAAVACPLIDPRIVRRQRERFRRDQIKELDLANSLFCPSGQYPSRAWILVKRSDYGQINKYARNLQLNFADVQTGTTLTFSNLAVVQARCVTRGIAADSGAIYLVELTDGRGLVWNQWFEQGTTSAYNVRSPAYPEQFYSGSLNGANPWTWDQLVGNLWGQMAPLGAYPGLPMAPSGTPENYWFPGTPSWEALNLILDNFGMVVSCDLTKPAPFGIATASAADAAFTANEAKYALLVEDDYEYLDSGAGRVPGSVVVYFHRRNQYYGTEETIRRDASQWSMTPLYAVTVAAPAQFSSAVGLHHIWDDFTVRYDLDNQPLAADVATANAIAATVVADYFGRIVRSTVGFLRRVYPGVLPFANGAQLDGVRWYMGATNANRERYGWLTEVVRGFLPPWPEVERHRD